MVLLSPNFCGAMGMEGGGGGKVGGRGGGGGRLGVQQVSRLDTGRTGGGGEV